MSGNTKHGLPQAPLRFLRWFCHADLLEDIEGDLTEMFNSRACKNLRRARILFVLDILLLFRPGIIRNFNIDLTQNFTVMFFNNIKTAIRQALKYKGYAAINLMGLVVGLFCCIPILLWVNQELSTDRFHQNADRIYKAYRNMYQSNGEVETSEGVPQPLVAVLKEQYPEIDQVTLYGWEIEFLFRHNDESTFEKGRYTSPEFFEIFSFPFAAGNPSTAFVDLHSVVISEQLAKKYFGTDGVTEAIGKTFTVDNSQDFVVTGVFYDPGSNSSLNFDWIIPAEEYIQRNDWVSDWGNGGFRLYFTVIDGANVEDIKKRIEQEVNTHTSYDADERVVIQKFTDSYLYSKFENGVPVGGKIQFIKVLSVIAIFALVIACINFMNLATARSSTRSKEIGVRKVLGAQRASLSQQFFTESFLHATVSLAVALLFVKLALPELSTLFGIQLNLDFSSPQLWIGIIGVISLTGLMAGSYPALMLSSFKIINSLKGSPVQAAGSPILRHGLATFQFSISTLLISGTLVISQQIDYILQKNVGLDKENIIMYRLEGDLNTKTETYRNELLKIPEVKNVTFTSGNPLSYGASTGGANWEGKDPNSQVEVNVLTVGDDFLETMGANIIEGKGFDDVYKTDSSRYLVNEVLADIIGFKSPVSKRLYCWGTEGEIIGVVRDFHMASMYEPIAPLIIRYGPSSTRNAFVRVQHDTQKALVAIETVTKKLNPDYPFRYAFMDEEYAKEYQSEASLAFICKCFSGVAIFISCLGLLGLTSFAADRRSREIGIRKVLGANVGQIVVMLSRRYTLLMLIAFITAAPLAYYLLNAWLNNFAFKMQLSLWPFALAGMVTILVGILTVSLKALQAARINPVETLKEQ